MKKLLILTLLLVYNSIPSFAAIQYNGSYHSADTTGSTSYDSSNFVPVAGDFITVTVFAAGTTATGSVTYTAGGFSFTKINSTTLSVNGTTGTLYLFAADALTTGSEGNNPVTFDCTGNSATGAIIIVQLTSGMVRTGSSAIRQSAVVTQQAAGIISVNFASATLTTSLIAGAVVNGVNPANITSPFSPLMAERADVGFDSPTVGMEYAVTTTPPASYTTITWTSESSTVFSAMIFEIDGRALNSGKLIVVH
jgi:hypothetical protein